MQEPWLIIFLVGIMADIAARCQAFKSQRSAPKAGTVRDLHVSLCHLNSLPGRPSLKFSGRIIEATASDRRVPLRLNIRCHTCTLFSENGGAARWLSGSCSNADIFASSSRHLHGSIWALWFASHSMSSVFIFFFQNGGS